MSKLETNTIDTVSGTTNLVIGSTNSSTVTFENGAPTGHMYPAFEAFLSANQTMSSNTNTKVQANTEIFDTDNCYDNSTNYRFTPNKAGKYFVYAKGRGDANGTNDVQRVISIIYKNGAELMNAPFYGNISNPHNFFTPLVAGVVDMNGSSDYVEFFINILVSSGTPQVYGAASLRTTTFGAYRIGA